MTPNVIFEVYKMQKSTVTQTNVLGSTPVLTGMQGHLQDLSSSPQGERQGLADKDRSITHQLIVRPDTTAKLRLLKSGVFIKIVKYLHPDTKSWTNENLADYVEDTTFEVKIRNLITSQGRYLKIGMTTKVLE